MNESARQKSLEEFQMQLLTYTKDPATHFTSLNAALSERLVCRYQDSAIDPKVSTEAAVAKASQLLMKLPALPPQIDLTSYLWGDPSKIKLPTGYLAGHVPTDDNSVNSRSPWAQLQVVSGISSVILKLALVVTNSGSGRYSLGLSIRSFVDFVSELMDASSSGSRRRNKYDPLENSILNAFLWTTWQRSLMLLYWFVLKTHLVLGYNKEWDVMLALRGCSQLMNPSVRETLYGWANQSHEYMCT
jgi:hypothetical protein